MSEAREQLLHLAVELVSKSASFLAQVQNLPNGKKYWRDA